MNLCLIFHSALCCSAAVQLLRCSLFCLVLWLQNLCQLVLWLYRFFVVGYGGLIFHSVVGCSSVSVVNVVGEVFGALLLSLSRCRSPLRHFFLLEASMSLEHGKYVFHYLYLRLRNTPLVWGVSICSPHIFSHLHIITSILTPHTHPHT